MLRQGQAAAGGGRGRLASGRRGRPPESAPQGVRRRFRHADRAAGVFETILVIGGKPWSSSPPRPAGGERLVPLRSAASASHRGTGDGGRAGAQWALIASESARTLIRGAGLQTEISIRHAPEAFCGASPGSLRDARPRRCSRGPGPAQVARSQRSGGHAPFLRPVGCVEQLLLVDVDGAVLETERANLFAVCAAS